MKKETMRKQTVATDHPIINPQELRIGNLLHLRHSDYCNVLQVASIYRTGIVANWYGSFELNDWNYPEIEGIPLTDELMSKLGFVYDEVYNNNGKTVKMWKGDILVGKEETKYLHQLQNLYYVLVGEEMPINLKSDELW